MKVYSLSVLYCQHHLYSGCCCCYTSCPITSRRWQRAW